MVQVVVESELREEAARAVALDTFTLIADAEADVPENGRVATLTEDATEAGTWWADIVEDIPSNPPAIEDRGRWKLSLAMPSFLEVPETIAFGRAETDPAVQVTAGVYTILDNLRNPDDQTFEFSLAVPLATTCQTFLDFAFVTPAGVTVPAGQSLGEGSGSMSAALEAVGWPAGLTSDTTVTRSETRTGSVLAEGDRRYAVVGLRQSGRTTTPLLLGLIADWDAIKLTPPGGARRFTPEGVLSFASVAEMTRVFGGLDPDASELAGWMPGSWQARESLERLTDACGRMVRVGAERFTMIDHSASYMVVDVTGLEDDDIEREYGRAGLPVSEVTLPVPPAAGYVPGSGVYRDRYKTVPDGFGALTTGTVTEEYLLYLAERHISGAIADIFTELYANHEGVVTENELDPENHTYKWRLGDKDGDNVVTQQTDWLTIVFSGQRYIPGDGKISKTSCVPLDPTTEDTEDDTITLTGPLMYDNTVSVTETTETSTTFTETVELENGTTINAGDGIDSVSDTLTEKFGFSASEAKDTTVSKTVSVEIQVDVPDQATWTLHMTVTRGGQSCEVQINATPDWKIEIRGGDGFGCPHEVHAFTWKNYVCPGDVVQHGDRLYFDSLGEFLSWLGGYNIKNLQMKNFHLKGLAEKGAGWLGDTTNYRVNFAGRQSDTSDSNASYRIDKGG